MSDVRAGVDALDEQIVSLLAGRAKYMEAAARIKGKKELIRDEERKAAVIARAQRQAESLNAPFDLVTAVYETLVEESIAYEMKVYDELPRQ
ncbi:MAG: chorismate mutase [Caulobacteraceae bacterium]